MKTNYQPNQSLFPSGGGGGESKYYTAPDIKVTKADHV